MTTGNMGISALPQSGGYFLMAVPTAMQLAQLANEIPLEKLGENINLILEGKIRGRTVGRLS